MDKKNYKHGFDEALSLLKQLIKTPSFSKEEHGTAIILKNYLSKNEVPYQECGNNIWCKSYHFDDSLPTILLNSHHDTVRPNKGYQKDPFHAIEEEGKLYGLGSNDAGGALVCLLITFLRFHRQRLPFNLIFAASAEEEISGENGMSLLLKNLPPVTFGIVGEPTELKMAEAEKGLMVLDCYSYGESGHAARRNGLNAIELALDDLNWFKTFQFPEVSDSLGAVNMSVTQINSGTQHNVIPAECHFVVDVRTTDAYTNEEVVEIIKAAVSVEVKPRSTRLQPSGINREHPLVLAAKNLGIALYGSPTMSDQALISFPTVKIGPGKSERSHTADEFIYLNEIKEGIEIYTELVNSIIIKQP